MLGECETGTICTIYILDGPKGYWKKRSIFLNFDDENFGTLFANICSKYNVLINFRDNLEVNYESRSY